jgi:hypothetical protein
MALTTGSIEELEAVYIVQLLDATRLQGKCV